MHAPRSHADPQKALIAVVAVPVVLALAILTFAWPSANLAPRDLPLGVAGPAEMTQPVEQRLAEHAGAFELHRYADEAAAREAIEEREVYGAVVASPDGPRVLTASGASPLVSGLLGQALAPPAEPANGAVVTDVVPADADDPRGSAFASLVLPLVLASVIAGVIVSILGRPGWIQVAAIAGAAVGAALVATAMVQTWLGVIEGDWLVNAGVLALTVTAVASLLAGLNALLGHAGLAIGAVLMILVGNPWSGVSSAPELLPEGVGVTGQLLPPGAGGSLLRSTAFFDGGGAGEPLAVLLAWTALGLGAIGIGWLLRRRRAAAPEPVPAGA
jgi:hypothetical protein